MSAMRSIGGIRLVCLDKLILPPGPRSSLTEPQLTSDGETAMTSPLRSVMERFVATINPFEAAHCTRQLAASHFRRVT